MTNALKLALFLLVAIGGPLAMFGAHYEAVGNAPRLYRTGRRSFRGAALWIVETIGRKTRGGDDVLLGSD